MKLYICIDLDRHASGGAPAAAYAAAKRAIASDKAASYAPMRADRYRTTWEKRDSDPRNDASALAITAADTMQEALTWLSIARAALDDSAVLSAGRASHATTCITRAAGVLRDWVAL